MVRKQDGNQTNDNLYLFQTSANTLMIWNIEIRQKTETLIVFDDLCQIL